MKDAAGAACGRRRGYPLRLRLTDDPNTRLIASKIIELAQRGLRDSPTLSAMTLKEFKHY